MTRLTAASDKQCGECRKAVHDTRADAKRIVRKYRDGTHAYPCPHGNGFHVGHMPKAIRSGLLDRSELR